MSYLALYRKYRPVGFGELVGQEHIVRTLTNQIKADKIGHAYLFAGTRGVGKTSAARIFAKAINCESPANGSPCGKCSSCVSLGSPNIDIVEMDGASNNRVDEARELKENAIYPPTIVRYKVYIIDEVHMLTGNAFNALLKIIEEPPAHVVFILCTTEAHKIPQTVLSRVMRFDFRPVSLEAIFLLLKSIFDDLGKGCEEDALRLIARAARGSVRDALTMADSALNASDLLTYETASEVLGLTDNATLYSISKGILSGDPFLTLSAAERALDAGKPATLLARDLCLHFRDLYLVKICGTRSVHVPPDTARLLEAASKDASAKKILFAAEIFSKIEGELRYSTMPAVIFETAAFRAASGSGEIDADALNLRITSLERQVARLNSPDSKKKP